jgi:hypothetical protein
MAFANEGVLSAHEKITDGKAAAKKQAVPPMIFERNIDLSNFIQ